MGPCLAAIQGRALLPFAGSSKPHPVKRERGARILYGVVRVLLDVTAQQVGRQEPQAQLAMVLEVEQVHGVDHLSARGVSTLRRDMRHFHDTTTALLEARTGRGTG
jgi:hypothetical protein